MVPYISHRPEYREQAIAGDGFVLWACDGLWDEMASETAVGIVSELLEKHPEPGADICGMLIDRALEVSRSLQLHSRWVIPTAAVS